MPAFATGLMLSVKFPVAIARFDNTSYERWRGGRIQSNHKPSCR